VLVRYDFQAEVTERITALEAAQAQAQADGQAQGAPIVPSDANDVYVAELPAPTTTVSDGSTPTPTEPPTVPGGSGVQDVRTVPWSDLGVSGQDAVGTTHQFFLRTDDGWQRVAQDKDDIGPVKLGVVGDRFYLAADSTQIAAADGPGLVYTSADGENWTSAEIPIWGYVNAVGDALVVAAWRGGIELSRDYGTTWEDVDTSTTGMSPNVQVTQITGGPLGLALVVQDGDGAPLSLVTTADLQSWTATPISDISGIADVAFATVFVGRDRLVVSALGHGGLGNNPPAPQATVVGVPARS
jgi:hypothetical protein